MRTPLALRAGAQRSEQEKAERAAAEVEYVRARVAAETWQREETRRIGTPIVMHPDADRMRQHNVDLARGSPAITIEWLHPRHHSTRLVGRGNAVAYVSDR